MKLKKIITYLVLVLLGIYIGVVATSGYILQKSMEHERYLIEQITKSNNETLFWIGVTALCSENTTYEKVIKHSVLVPETISEEYYRIGYNALKTKNSTLFIMNNKLFIYNYSILPTRG